MSKDNHRENEWENDLPAKSHREGETRCHGGQGCRAESGPATESFARGVRSRPQCACSSALRTQTRALSMGQKSSTLLNTQVHSRSSKCNALELMLTGPELIGLAAERP